MMKNRFSDSFKVKVLSVLIAFGMWVYIMEKEDPIRIESLESLPISEITNLHEVEERGLTFSYEDLTVNVDVKGRRSSLLNYIRTKPVVKGTIDNPSSGQNKLLLSIVAPSDIEYSFEPRFLQVELEESVISKEVIEVIPKGQPKESFSIKKINLSRDFAYIEGPKSQVDKVEKLVAELSIDGASKDYSLKVKLTPVDSKGVEIEGVAVDREFIVADVKVEHSKEVPVELIFVNSAGEKVENDSIYPDKEKVVITGPPDKLKTIETVYSQDIFIKDINLYNDRDVDLKRIDGITMNTNRIHLKVNTDKEKDYYFDIDSSNIRLATSLREEEIRAKLPEHIGVSFRASQSYQDKISSESILLSIDNKEDKDSYEIQFSIEYPVNSILLDLKEVVLSKE